MKKKYQPEKIEKYWQEKWEKQGLYKTPEDVTPENKMYILPQLPYPSGSGLHVGHAEVYTACDIYARYQRMIGKKVLQVVGWDSFGLPAENYAIKTNVHPKINTDKAIDNFRSQIKSLGISVDWDREVGSHNSDYYKWTQWFFLLFYKRGLAYRKMQAVNWCDSCKTVLANEQVVDGHCERCDHEVIQRNMEQWYMKITEYADRLIADLDKIDWPEETKKRQKDWIGRSEGATVKFKIVMLSERSETTEVETSRDSTDEQEDPSTPLRSTQDDEVIEVFTTRPDTLFGVTYMVLAPEHILISELQSSISNYKEVEKYIEKASKKTELERKSEKEKTGIELKGVKAINPANGEEIPVWVADYVLASYGSGAIMAVPAHDERDFEFAKKFDLPIVEVVSGGNIEEAAHIKDGELVNSEFLNGLKIDESKAKMIEWLEEKKIGERKIQYKLRDWSVSRQRFWGSPIPMLVNEERKNKKYKYVFIHGFTATGLSDFRTWLKTELETLGHTVVALDLPDTNNPNVAQQAEYVLDKVDFDEDTVIVAHSLGGPVTFRVLEKLETKIAKVLLVDTVLRPEFNDKKRPDVEKSDSFEFDFEKIKKAADEFVLLVDSGYGIIKKEHFDEMQESLGARLVVAESNEQHFTNEKEEVVLEESVVSGLMPTDMGDLPVELPDDVDFKPTGQSPLTYSENFQKGVEEKYGSGWKREVDTLDTFMCSSWYYFRYLDPKNDEAFASPEALKKWMPVDFYLGGEEHVNGHLLYSRFFTKVLYDAGYIDFDEPFTKHRHQGLILGPDHRKMSKRWDNVVNPTDVVNKFGADTLRMYEMFMGPLEQTKPWDTNGVKGIRRFLERVWSVVQGDYIVEDNERLAAFAIWDFGDVKLDEIAVKKQIEDKSREMHSLTAKTIKKVSEDLGVFKFNTAISSLMIFINEVYKFKVCKDDFLNFIKLLAPFAPHMAEEIWHSFGHDSSVTTEAWPEYDSSKIVDDVITIAVQVNGKVRATVEVATDISEEDVKKLALGQENVLKWIDGKEPKKVIYVKGRLVSVVV